MPDFTHELWPCMRPHHATPQADSGNHGGRRVLHFPKLNLGHRDNCGILPAPTLGLDLVGCHSVEPAVLGLNCCRIKWPCPDGQWLSRTEEKILHFHMNSLWPCLICGVCSVYPFSHSYTFYWVHKTSSVAYGLNQNKHHQVNIFGRKVIFYFQLFV